MLHPQASEGAQEENSDDVNQIVNDFEQVAVEEQLDNQVDSDEEIEI